MSHIHWYPGHIAKAQRALKEKLKLVDVILEVLDARIPISSSYGDTKTLLGEKPRIILLNKSDLSDDKRKPKMEKIYRRENRLSLPFNHKSKSKRYQDYNR